MTEKRRFITSTEHQPGDRFIHDRKVWLVMEVGPDSHHIQCQSVLPTLDEAREIADSVIKEAENLASIAARRKINSRASALVERFLGKPSWSTHSNWGDRRKAEQEAYAFAHFLVVCEPSDDKAMQILRDAFPQRV